MNRPLAQRLGCAAVVALIPVLCAGPATADSSDVVYFRFAGADCTATSDGVLGCDLPAGTMMDTPLISGSANGPTTRVEVREIVMDGPGQAMRVASGTGTPHTLPGGNPAPVYEGSASYYQRIAGGGGVVCGSFHSGPATCYSGKHGFGISGTTVTIS